MTDEFMQSTAGGPKLPALKFTKVGDVHSGVVTAVTKLEDRDPAGNAKTYDNGDPRYVFVLRSTSRPAQPTCGCEARW